jgi:hypothetical protein
MTDIAKVVVSWSNFTGQPGYSVFYKVAAGLVTTNLRTFYDSIKAYLPSNLAIQVPNSGDVINDATGVLSGSWSTATNLVVTGTSSSVYAAGSGAVAKWRSSGIVAGRRVVGRTFLIPLTGGAFDTNGTLLAAPLLILQNAAAALVTAEAGNLLVWHRPKAGAGGLSFPVVSSDVPDRSALMRSRRD